MSRRLIGRMTWLASTCALFILGGCASGRNVTVLPDGTSQARCNGGYHDWSACYRSAQRYCGKRGYRITAQISDEGGAVGVGDWSRAGSEVSRTLEFRCDG